jgi:hypothetical protein
MHLIKNLFFICSFIKQYTDNLKNALKRFLKSYTLKKNEY